MGGNYLPLLLYVTLQIFRYIAVFLYIANFAQTKGTTIGRGRRKNWHKSRCVVSTLIICPKESFTLEQKLVSKVT